jgi:acyl-CoA dehydrogenase
MRLRSLLSVSRRIDIQLIRKMSRKGVGSNAIFVDRLVIPEADRFGEEGKGLSHILRLLNPMRILIASKAIGAGQNALRRAPHYAVTLKRPVGQNQTGRQPLTEKWIYLEVTWLMTVKAAELYEQGLPCQAEENSAKFIGARAGHDVGWRSIVTLSGFGDAKDYHVERLYREVLLTRLAPTTEQLILSFVTEKDLGTTKRH